MRSCVSLARCSLNSLMLVGGVLLSSAGGLADTLYFNTGKQKAALKIEAVVVTGIRQVAGTDNLEYTVNGRPTSRPLALIVQIEVDGEPLFNQAEIECINGNLDAAQDLYRRAIAVTKREWIEQRASQRPDDAALQMAGIFPPRGPDVLGSIIYFNAMARRNPMAARKPDIPKNVKKEELASAAKTISKGLADASVETKLVLLSFLCELYTARGEPKLAREAYDEIRKLALVEPSAPGLAHVTFIPTDAQRIVFVCDASGSMINKMPTLKDQLGKALKQLNEKQFFDLIFFQDNKIYTLIKTIHSDDLIAATDDGKRKAEEFLKVITTTGSTDPIPAIRAAFNAKPQVIYYLTDGDSPDDLAVLKTFRDLNKSMPATEKVKINTIAFVGDGDNDVLFIILLKKIAKETGGTFRFVREPDL